jgi:hypothetical protein
MAFGRRLAFPAAGLGRQLAYRSAMLWASTTLGAVLCCVIAVPTGAAPVDRPFDPVVVEGASVPALIGAPVDRIVAFRHAGSAWEQLPVQVDEMAWVDWSTVYNGLIPSRHAVRTYTDGGTFTGSDPDPAFDADDELVFMAREMAYRFPGGGDPPGVLAGSRIELRVRDPRQGNTSWVYLFRSDGSLDPGMGAEPVVYTFRLDSGDYRSSFDIEEGPNPEDSSVVTPYFRVHFADRWIRDETAVTDGTATGIDMLDRHKFQFAPGDCGRTEETASEGEGAFMANRSGPVRAIRAYVGANSGVTTHRVHRFYDRQEEILTGLEVHVISGIVDYFDYSPKGSRLLYSNSLDPGTQVEIDGEPDPVVLGDLEWELVTGTPGTIAMVHILDTSIADLPVASFYTDDVDPEVTQCTGDSAAFGQSGPSISGGIPNTDPTNDPYDRFVMSRVIRYGAPGQTEVFAERLYDEVVHPLVVEVEAPLHPPPPAPAELRRTDRR